ncbi:MAG TPA: hypothetical protein VFM18_13840 [Methanosarcina sp.]|nr:hypothetical protein [Methanosarcina sp.]
MNVEPLIYTIKGNLPQAELTYKTEWDVNDAYIKFTERHYDSTGELVRESCHVYDKKGLSGEVATSF